MKEKKFSPVVLSHEHQVLNQISSVGFITVGIKKKNLHNSHLHLDFKTTPMAQHLYTITKSIINNICVFQTDNQKDCLIYLVIQE